MTRTTNYRILNPITATTREVAEVLNRTVDGKLNSVGEFTVAASTTTTNVTEPRAGKESVILLSPQDTHFYSVEPFISTKNNGSFVVTTTSHGTDAVIEYVIIG